MFFKKYLKIYFMIVPIILISTVPSTVSELREYFFGSHYKLDPEDLVIGSVFFIPLNTIFSLVYYPIYLIYLKKFTKNTKAEGKDSLKDIVFTGIIWLLSYCIFFFP